jgi:uncharacterized membrane protein
MRRLVKFLHTIGAIGMMGAMASFLVLLSFLPEPSSLAEYARIRLAMAGISNWIFLPSLVLTLISGLLAIAVTRAYQDVGWVWVKLASGISVFEGGLTAVHGAMGREAALSTQALSQGIDPAKLGASLDSEWGVLWVMMAVSAANVAFGVWRPRFRRK